MSKSLEALKEISRLTISSLSFEEILDQMMEITLDTISCDAGSILLVEDDSLTFKVAKGEKGELLKRIRVKIGEGIAGWVAEHGEPLLVPDVTKDERFLKKISEEIDYKTYNIICAPMKPKERTIGVIELINKKEKEPFTKDDLELLETISDQAGLVVENYYLKRYSEKKAKELKTLVDVGLILNATRNIKELLDLSMRMAKTTMNAEASSLMLIDEATGELVFEVTEGGKEEVKEIRLKPGEGIAGWVAEHGEPLLVPDVTKDERFTVKVDEKSGFSTKSILAAPLKTKKKVIGVIEAINKIGRESFAEEEIEFFMLLANQIALAIENAKLYSYVLGEEEEPVEEPYIEAKGEKKPIGQILKEFNLITEEHLRKALEIQEREGRRRKVGQILVEELRVLTEDALNCALSHQLNIPYVTLTPEMIDPDVARLLPYDMLTRHCVIPIMRFENEIDVVMADPLDTDLISDIEKITDCTVKVSLGSKTNISEMIQQVLGPPPKIVEEKKALEEEDKGGERYLFEQIDKAISTGATELHFEPTEDVVKTRYRVGSVLHAQPDQPISIYPSLLFRAKMLAGLDLLKKDVYQKGMAESVPGITEAGFEISCGPTIYGEALTVKIIRREREALPSLADYGLEDAELSLLKRFIQNRRGVVVVGGEKGFRIRFAYSILMEADSEKRKVVTVCSQSPFKVTQFLQIPVTPSFSADDGFDMAIDQDADIVLLEEARPDIYRKVFERSFERLVFVQTPYPSTTDTLYSLFDLLDSTLIASCLNGIVGCWTESRVCSSCKGEGCEVCNLSGVLEERRLEIMDVTEKIKGCIREKMSCGRIIEEAEKEGFVLKKKIEVCNV